MQTAVSVVGEESEMRDIVLARVGPPPPPAGTSRRTDPHSLPAPQYSVVLMSVRPGLLDFWITTELGLTRLHTSNKVLI